MTQEPCLGRIYHHLIPILRDETRASIPSRAQSVSVSRLSLAFCLCTLNQTSAKIIIIAKTGSNSHPQVSCLRPRPLHSSSSSPLASWAAFNISALTPLHSHLEGLSTHPSGSTCLWSGLVWSLFLFFFLTDTDRTGKVPAWGRPNIPASANKHSGQESHSHYHPLSQGFTRTTYGLSGGGAMYPHTHPSKARSEGLKGLRLGGRGHPRPTSRG